MRKIFKTTHVRTTAINTAVVLAAFVTALIFVEIALRILFVDPIQEDSVLGHVMRSGGEWDADGFRNKEVLDTAEVVVIGDSQTEGNNATREEAWPQQYGVISGEEVYQFAVGGYGPAQYYALFNKALEKKPEKIFIGFYLGNDLLDAERMVYQYDAWKGLRNDEYTSQSSVDDVNYRLVLSSGLHPDSFQMKVLEIRTWIRNNVRTYALLGNATRSLREWMGVAKTSDEKQETLVALAEERNDLVYVYEEDPINTIMSPTYRLDTVDLSSEKAQEGWRITQEIFKRIHAEARSADVDVSIVIIPTKEMVYMEYVDTFKNSEIPPQFDNYVYSEEVLSEEVRDFCTEYGIDCIFVRSDMAKALNDKKEIYGKTMDGHPNKNGYQVIAESVYAQN